ncbi:unnamed protein product [Discosporangium mesarthrocarpum]
MLSRPNHCNLEACAPLLAAGGPPFVEALLWLHRGRGRHRETLALATEDRCVVPPLGTGSSTPAGGALMAKAGPYSSASGGGASAGWLRADFHKWMAQYLRELWFSDDPAHPPLVLRTARPLLEADTSLGLSVFMGMPTQTQAALLRGYGGVRAQERSAGPGEGEVLSVGGKGLAAQEVVAFLKGITPCEAAKAKAEAESRETMSFSKPSKDVEDSGASPTQLPADLPEPPSIPLTSGRAIAVGYLQSLISVYSYPLGKLWGDRPDMTSLHPGAAGSSLSALSVKSPTGNVPTGNVPTGNVPTGEVSSLHDELAYLLMEGLLVEQGAGTDMVLPERQQAEAETPGLAGVYRQQLQYFLQMSESYNPARLLAVVPSHFLEEHALLLSRLGRHEEVLDIYVRQLKNFEVAEAYCARIWERATRQGHSMLGTGKLHHGGRMLKRSSAWSGDTNVYVSLLKVYLSQANSREGNAESSGGNKRLVGETGGEGGGKEVDGLDAAISLLERHFPRLDPLKVLTLLPPDIAVSRLQPFLSSAIVHADSQRRAKQIMHQLCRADYVNVKYELIQLQSRVSRVPELSLASFAHLGKVMHTCPPVDLTDPTADYGVSCVKHIFESHVVLQFNITNTSSDQRLQKVLVRVECSDLDLYSLKEERPLPALPPHGTGSCYTVLAHTPSARGAGRSTGLVESPALFMCELRFISTRVGTVVGRGKGEDPAGEGFSEEYALEDLELSMADLRGS